MPEIAALVPALLALFGFAIVAIVTYRRTREASFLGILAATVLWPILLSLAFVIVGVVITVAAGPEILDDGLSRDAIRIGAALYPVGTTAILIPAIRRLEHVMG